MALQAYSGFTYGSAPYIPPSRVSFPFLLFFVFYWISSYVSELVAWIGEFFEVASPLACCAFDGWKWPRRRLTVLGQMLRGGFTDLSSTKCGEFDNIVTKGWGYCELWFAKSIVVWPGKKGASQLMWQEKYTALGCSIVHKVHSNPVLLLQYVLCTLWLLIQIPMLIRNRLNTPPGSQTLAISILGTILGWVDEPRGKLYVDTRPSSFAVLLWRRVCFCRSFRAATRVSSSIWSKLYGVSKLFTVLQSTFYIIPIINIVSPSSQLLQ
jgi:hypothetical protein